MSVLCNIKFLVQDNSNHNIKVHEADPFSSDIFVKRRFMTRKNMISTRKNMPGFRFKRNEEVRWRDFGRFIIHAWYSGGRIHVCKIRGKRFSSAGSLKGHRDSVHLGLRQWGCDD